MLPDLRWDSSSALFIQDAAANFRLTTRALISSDLGTFRLREHLAELHRRIAETDQWLVRPFDAIAAGTVDRDDALAKERMTSLKATRNHAATDAVRTRLAFDSSGIGVTPDMRNGVVRKAGERLRLDVGGDGRGHLRALVQRVEVAYDEARIMR